MSGYTEYARNTLAAPTLFEFGEASSDDLSSEWDTEDTENGKDPYDCFHHKKCAYKKGMVSNS